MVADAAGVPPSVAGFVFGVQREFAAGAVFVSAVLIYEKARASPWPSPEGRGNLIHETL